MKRRMLSMLMLTCLMALGLQTIFVLPVSAKKNVEKKPVPLPVATQLTLSGPEKVDLNQPFVVEGTLKGQDGANNPA